MPEVLYYDATFFAEYDLKVPTTWEEVEAVSRQIKEIDPDSVPLGYDSEGNWFITLAEQYGYDYTAAVEKIEDRFTFDNKGNKDLVKELAEWYKDGLVTTQTLYGSYTSGLFTNLTPNEDGNLIRSYMCIGSSAGATHQRPTKVDGAYPFQVGIAPLPQKDATKAKAISQGPSVVMLKSTAQEEAASWLLLEFLTTDVSFQAEFSMASGYMPVLESVQNHPEYKAWLDSANGGDNIAALSAKAAFEQKDAYFTSPAFVGSSQARDQVGNLIVSAMTSAAKNELTDAKLDSIFKNAVDECIYNTK
jgi:multiple sugar transport system substrate-binding protein